MTDKIPQWAMELAVNCITTQRYVGYTISAKVIARALMAERERAAKICENYSDLKYILRPLSTYQEGLADAASVLSVAIRKEA